MEKIKQGQKITVEHKDGYSWKNELVSWCIFILYTVNYIYLLKDEEKRYSLFFEIFGFIFLCVLLVSLIFYISYPEKIHHKQYTIYFFKEYLLLENFNKSLDNHELYYYAIKRIYSQQEGFMSIDINDNVDLILIGFKKNGIKNLKLENHLIKNTNELTEYLNTYIEDAKINKSILIL